MALILNSGVNNNRFSWWQSNQSVVSGLVAPAESSRGRAILFLPGEKWIYGICFLPVFFPLFPYPLPLLHLDPILFYLYAIFPSRLSTRFLIKFIHQPTLFVSPPISLILFLSTYPRGGGIKKEYNHGYPR